MFLKNYVLEKFCLKNEDSVTILTLVVKFFGTLFGKFFGDLFGSSVLSKYFNPERLNVLRTLDDEHIKPLYSSSVPIAFTQMQRSLPSVLPKRVYPFSMRMLSKSTHKKFASLKKASPGKISRRSLGNIAKKNNLEAKKKRSVVTKKIATNSSH